MAMYFCVFYTGAGKKRAKNSTCNIQSSSIRTPSSTIATHVLVNEVASPRDSGSNDTNSDYLNTVSYHTQKSKPKAIEKEISQHALAKRGLAKGERRVKKSFAIFHTILPCNTAYLLGFFVFAKTKTGHQECFHTSNPSIMKMRIRRTTMHLIGSADFWCSSAFWSCDTPSRVCSTT